MQDRKSEKKRGTQNELEILQIIISENRTLFMKVMDKIRIYREMRGLSAFEELKRNEDAKIKKLRERAKL